MIYTIYPIRKNFNFLPAVAGIALMTITACASANLGDFSKATQDAAIAAALETATAEATAAAQTAATAAATAQDLAVATARAEEKQIAQTAQGIAVAAARCTTPVCDNVVDADDLPSFPTAAPSAASAFLTITGTEISTTGVTISSGGQRVAPTIRGATRAGDNTDGFRYFQGQFGGTGSTRYFAGILPTTNLGAPLTAQPTTAAWPGTYSRGASEDNNITFNIDFANRRITALRTDPNAFAVRFNLGFSDSGVISGVALVHTGAIGNEPLDGLAIATGLIGTEGLVGVFTENDSFPANGFYGGFVAANPSP